MLVHHVVHHRVTAPRDVTFRFDVTLDYIFRKSHQACVSSVFLSSPPSLSRFPLLSLSFLLFSLLFFFFLLLLLLLLQLDVFGGILDVFDDIDYFDYFLVLNTYY